MLEGEMGLCGYSQRCELKHNYSNSININIYKQIIYYASKGHFFYLFAGKVLCFPVRIMPFYELDISLNIKVKKF